VVLLTALTVNIITMLMDFLYLGVYKDIGPWMYNYLVDLHEISDLYHIKVRRRFNGQSTEQ